ILAFGITVIAASSNISFEILNSFSLFLTGINRIFICFESALPGPNIGCMQSGLMVLERFLSDLKVWLFTDDISANMAPGFICEAHSSIIEGVSFMGTQISTRSASCTQSETFLQIIVLE